MQTFSPGKLNDNKVLSENILPKPWFMTPPILKLQEDREGA